MTAVDAAAQWGSLPRRVPVVLFAAVVLAGITLLAIGARGPYTHSNLSGGFDPRYERTSQILVGAETEFAGLSPDAALTGADAPARGAALYVTHGCAGCHALEGRGGAVGPRLLGVDEETIVQRVRQGPLGMPRFSTSGLTAQEVSDIAAYLRSIAAD
jgi:mono/diheme cytochrome c family protein